MKDICINRKCAYNKFCVCLIKSFDKPCKKEPFKSNPWMVSETLDANIREAGVKVA